MPKIIIDPESRSLAEHYALVNAPNRRRARFPAACVQVVASEAEAIAGRTERVLPALVYGPSTSSEGQQLYYLLRWL